MDRIAELQKDLEVVRKEWNSIKQARNDCKFRQMDYATALYLILWVAQRKIECRVRMESLELALNMERNHSTTIEVKKEMIEANAPAIPLEYRGNVGSTAEKALDVDEMYVEGFQ